MNDWQYDVQYGVPFDFSRSEMLLDICLWIWIGGILILAVILVYNHLKETTQRRRKKKPMKSVHKTTVDAMKNCGNAVVTGAKKIGEKFSTDIPVECPSEAPSEANTPPPPEPPQPTEPPYENTVQQLPKLPQPPKINKNTEVQLRAARAAIEAQQRQREEERRQEKIRGEQEEQYRCKRAAKETEMRKNATREAFIAAHSADARTPLQHIPVEWDDFASHVKGLSPETSITDYLNEIVAQKNELRDQLKSGLFTTTPEVFPEFKNDRGKTIFEDGIRRPLWFIGDVHGDFLALKILTDFAYKEDYLNWQKERFLVQQSTTNQESALPPTVPLPPPPSLPPPTQLFFIGDLIDDGECSADIMAWVFSQMLHSANERKFDIRAILGNHDEALVFNEEKQQFASRVSPCEFSEQLNKHLDAPLVVEFGKRIVEFFKMLPKMALINKDVLAVHGGVPQTDLHDAIKSKEDLETPEALKDFVWVRLHERAPKRFPNRESSGAEIGYKDFAAFIEILTQITGTTPRNVIRGHDHVTDNFQHFENYACARTLTINAFSYRKRYGVGSPFRPLVILRYDPSETSQGKNLTLFKFTLPEQLVLEAQKMKSLFEAENDARNA